MDASKLWLLRDFIGSQKVLFRIPVYQRNYDWSEANCKKLLDDVRTIIDTGEKHFLGTIVYMIANGGGFSLRECTIIDGQQRLTTMMLLLKALADIANEQGDPHGREINDVYLHNQYCSEEFKIKLKPIKSDNEQFCALLNDKIGDIDKDSHIYNNYSLCKERLSNWVEKGIIVQDILNALMKLEIVEIVLTKGEDDPQVIFESINSTGLELSNADLIRNFLLMDVENQEQLYENYWLYIEHSLKSGSDYTNLNLFFREYIVYKTNSTVSSQSLYEHFVSFYKNEQYTQEKALIELKYYSDIFQAFVSDNSKYYPNICKTLGKIRSLKQTTCYPFLMHIFDDYEKHIITIEVLQNTVDLILSYLVRRMVCGVPSNTLRSLFTSLYNRVFKVSQNKQKYYESINKFLHIVSSKDQVPSDAEFKRALISTNLYSNPTLCKYLLTDIENGTSKEILNTETLSVEHIMPQSLSADWQKISDQDHEKYLHVLGNLTVTGYNSELSNKNFSVKKRIIHENSKAVILNSDVLDKDIWGPTEIKERGSRLAKILMQHYHIDKIRDETIEFEYVSWINLENAFSVTGKKLVSFKFDGAIYRQDKFTSMLVDVIKLLDRNNPKILEDLADENYSYSSGSTYSHISKDTERMRRPEEIRDGIFVETHLSAGTCMRFISSLIDKYEMDRSSFSISVITNDDPTDGDNEPEDEI